MKQQDLLRLYDAGILTELDVHFADFVAGLCEIPTTEISFAAAFVSNATRQGHICLDLSSLAGKQLLDGDVSNAPVACPDLTHWIKEIRKCLVVGRPGERKPLILDDHQPRIYLYRYRDYQDRLAGLIKKRVEKTVDVDLTVLKAGLDRLFTPAFAADTEERTENIDGQKIAALVASMKRFTVISGGPGTGKTTTVAKILALMLGQPDSGQLRIALAAPTGKAAAKLQEAIKKSKRTLDCPGDIKAQIPEEASTIHRLLGAIPGSPYFRHDGSNPLPVEAIVVDEASMVDLALMSKLVQALPLYARIILLGDKDQLASVEAGAVLGDMCDTGSVHGFSKPFRDVVQKVTGYEVHAIHGGDAGAGIQDCVVELHKNFRFGEESGIGALSRAVNSGDGDRAVTLLTEGEHRDLLWKDLPQSRILLPNIRSRTTRGFGGYLGARTVQESFELFDRYRVLSPLRNGPFGVVALNTLIEEVLTSEGLIEPDRKWYRGRPVLITKNDYNLGLFNGDVGIVWPEGEDQDDFRVFFLAPDGTLKRFHPLRLPEHETVYAMTVHKSQGSEFDNVLLILPDRESPVLTRELIYTGITRAREQVEVWGTEEVLSMAISRRIQRMSGLRDALWGEQSPSV